jgi:hypothetical protein
MEKLGTFCNSADAPIKLGKCVKIDILGVKQLIGFDHNTKNYGFIISILTEKVDI